MVVTVELEDFLPARKATGRPDGAHGRLGPGVRHPNHFDRRYDFADQLGQLHLQGGRRAEGGAFAGGFLDGLNDLRIGVTQDQGSVAHYVVQVGVAVSVENARTFAPLYKEWISPNGTERANRAIHSSGHATHSPLHEPGRAIHCERMPGLRAFSATLQAR